MSCTIDEKGAWHVGEMPDSALDPTCLVAHLLDKEEERKIDFFPPPPTTEQVQIYVAATALCLVEIGQLPPDFATVQRMAALLRIHPSQALPIWQAAIEIIKDPAVCPLLLNP